MNFLRRHWYNVGGVIAAATTIYAVFSWRDLNLTSALLLMNFIALLVHQFEEYGWPGGEPAIMNIVPVE